MSKRIWIFLVIILCIAISVGAYIIFANDDVETEYYNKALQDSAKLYGITRQIIGLQQQEKIDLVRSEVSAISHEVKALRTSNDTRRGEMIVNELITLAYDFLDLEENGISGVSDYNVAESFEILNSMQVQVDELEALINDLGITIDHDALKSIIESVVNTK